MGNHRNRLLLATGQELINREIEKKGDFDIAGVVNRKEELELMIAETEPSVVLVGEGMTGKGFLPALLLDITSHFPHIRIIYLAGEVSLLEDAHIEPLKSLARAGVYDLFHSGQIKKRELFHLLDTPRTQRDVAYLLEETTPLEEADVEYVEMPASIEKLRDADREEGRGEARVIAFSSIKPGTGKSFLAVNVAAAIAQFGIDRKDGRRPKVALIEADLQNLSVGTLLKMNEGDNHLLRAMHIIEKLMNASGELIVGEAELKDANRDLKKCLTPYDRARNLEILSGSQTTFRDVQSISSHYYSYLISVLRPHYDYIIIDGNSSMAHTTTFPILREADTAFYILNLDFNNVRNNIRYQSDLAAWKVLDKVRYILNEDYVPGKGGGKLAFGRRELEDLGFKLEATIPSVEKSIFLNSIYEGIPLILGSDAETETARHEIFKVANAIHLIMNFSENTREDLMEKKRKGFRGR